MQNSSKRQIRCSSHFPWFYHLQLFLFLLVCFFRFYEKKKKHYYFRELQHHQQLFYIFSQTFGASSPQEDPIYCKMLWIVSPCLMGSDAINDSDFTVPMRNIGITHTTLNNHPPASCVSVWQYLRQSAFRRMNCGFFHYSSNEYEHYTWPGCYWSWCAFSFGK